MVGVVYNEISRALAKYEQNRGMGVKFSIKPDAVFARIAQDKLMTLTDNINPIADVKRAASFSYIGHGGRDPESFVTKDRVYPEDGVGIISESTVDSGNAGINAQLSNDPNIVSTRGLFNTTTPDQLTPTQMLSVAASLVPGATNDDS
jgi:hypothetical protein